MLEITRQQDDASNRLKSGRSHANLKKTAFIAGSYNGGEACEPLYC